MANKILMEKNIEMNEILTPLQDNLIKLLYENGPTTRKELVNHLTIPRTTIYDNLLKLQKRRLLEKFTRNYGNRGRPLVFWKITE